MKHQVQEVVLKNGVRGLFIDIPDATVMEFEFQFRAGHRHTKAPKLYQTAHIMEHMAFGANLEYPSERQFTADFSKNGAYHNAYTSDFTMGYLASCADFEWERILQMQQLAICHPLFKDEQLIAEKGNIKNELSSMLSRDFVLLWPRLEQALGGRTMTFEDQIKTIDNVSLDDVFEHHKRTHTTDNLRFIIAGRITGRRNQLKKMLESWDLSRGKRLAIPQDKYHDGEPVFVDRSDSKSLTYGLSVSVPRILSQEEKVVFQAINHTLTGTLYSRILGKARERGLTYNIHSSLTHGLYDTCWDFVGQVVPEMAQDLIDLIADELVLAEQKGFTDQELEAAQSFGLGAYQMSLQTVSDVARFYSGNYFLKDEIADFRQVPEMIKSVTKRQINRLLREFLHNGSWVFGVVGNTNRRTVRRLNQSLSSIFAKIEEV